MPNRKGSTSSPPAGHNQGQQSSQRGPTPPHQRPDDYSQRNNQGYQTQQMNVQGMPGIYQGLVPQQGQPQPIPYFRPSMTRQIRVSHPSQQSNQPMYPSPTSGQQMIQMQGGGQPYMIPQPFVPQQVDYQTVPVGSPQMQYRPPPLSSMGYGNPQMSFPQYSMASRMPFVPPGQGQPFMFVRNPQMAQNMGGQQYQPVRQETQPPRKKNIIKIRDPNQDNKDVTDEILSSVAHSSSSSKVNTSGHSSRSNTPPINSSHEQDTNAATFMKQLADTLKDDKPKGQQYQPVPNQDNVNVTDEILSSVGAAAMKTLVDTLKDDKPTRLTQVTNSTSPKQSQIQGGKTIEKKSKDKEKGEKETVDYQTVPASSPQSLNRSPTPKFDDMELQDSPHNVFDDNEPVYFSVPAEILARGPQAIEAYRRALTDGKVSIYRGRIIIIGQDRAGKTSLRKSLCGLPFDQEEQSTVGVDAALFGLDVDHVTSAFELKVGGDLLNKETLHLMLAKDLKMLQKQEDRREKEANFREEMGEKTEYHVIDFAGQEVYVGMPIPEQYDHELVVANKEVVTEKESELSARFGLRIDDVDVELLIKFLQNEQLEETIADKETTISVWDFAGQHVYYASHQVFLSNRAIYLLVYNLAKDLDAPAEPSVRQGTVDRILDNSNNETNLDSVLSWLVSVHTLCTKEADDEHTKLPYKRPPVFVVGTHADEPFEDLKEMEKKLKIGILSKSYSKHVVRPCFTVNNKHSSNDEGIKSLHQKIMEVFGTEPYMGKEEPLPWLHFEKALKSIVEDKKTFFLSLDVVKKIAKDVCSIEDPDELTAMLDFYHDLGIIVKYGNTVVLHTQWLIDVFKKLITIRNFDNMDQYYTDHWLEMEESGKLHMELVDYIFKEELQCGQIKDDILKMMEHFGLIASFTQAGNESCYFVPSHLKSSPSEVFQETPASDDACPLYVHFPDGFIPHGLYTRLVCKLISWCKDCEPTLYRDASEYVLDMSSQTSLVVVCYRSSIKLLLQSNSKERSYLRTKANEVRKFVEETLSGLRDQCPWYRCLRYEICVSCPSCAKKPCFRHLPTCNEEKCLHLLPTIKDQPFWCKKSCGKDRWPIVSGYNYWCPEMPCASETADQSSSCTVVVPTAGILHLDDNVKRWVVVGISLNTVLIPALRDYLEPYMESHYEHFKTNNNIDTQIHPGQLKKDGTATLNYGSINNNKAVHGKKAASFDYNVTSYVDLGKLYLQPYMAKFTDYNNSCDASAVLGILCSASVFSSIKVQSIKVKDDVRNRCGHFNNEEWDETKFDEYFEIMVKLVQSLALPSDDKQQLTDKLEEWKNQGLELLTPGNTENEMRLLMEKVGDLSKNLSSLVDDEGKQDIVEKLLEIVKTAIIESMREIKQKS